VLDRFELSDGHVRHSRTDNASSNHSITRELHSTLESSGIQCSAWRNHIPCMAHVIQLALGAFMSSLGVRGRCKFWEPHEHDKQFGENESMDIGKSQRLRKEGNARINKVSAMGPGLAKIIEKVCISWYFERPETDLHVPENACGIDYADTWSPKRLHWLSKCQSLHCSTADYGCEDTLEPKKCWKLFLTITSGPGKGGTQTVAKLAVRVINKPEQSSRVWFDGKLLTRLNWAGCQRVAQQVQP